MKIYSLQCPISMDDKQFHALLPCVSPEKREKLLRFRKPGDAYRGLWAELLIRALIMERTGLTNNQIVFGKDRFHKPFLYTFPSFHFNLSHSGQWILCAIDSQPVGVDIEKIQPVKQEMIKLALTSQEETVFWKMPSTEKSTYFFKLWTIKESYLKSIGTGLNCLPNTLSIQFAPSNETSIVFSKDNKSKRFCRSYSIDTNYQAAVCRFENHFPRHVIKKEMHSVIEVFQ